MILPQKIEREYRFRLALRMGLPIFGILLILLLSSVYNNFDALSLEIFFELVLLFMFSVYFFLYLIYKGFDKKITDEITKTFSREYLYNYLQKEINKNEVYTLLLISIDNLSDINNRYGLKNGDKVLYKIGQWIVEYLRSKDLDNFPIGHIKGGDFIIGLKGYESEYKTLIDLLCIKSDELKIDNIEIKLSGALVDTTLTKNLEHLIDTLFERINKNNCKYSFKSDDISPNELESTVIDSIRDKNIVIFSQNVYNRDFEVEFQELFVRLKTRDEKIIHPQKFLKVINKLGLTLEFDIVVLEKALEYVKQNKQKVAISISATSLRENKFFSKLKHFQNVYDYDKGNLILLFSENEYYSKIEKFNNILKTFKEKGVEIAVDKLGFLHSSFLYLKDLDIDIVRYDRDLSKNKNIFKYNGVIQGLDIIAKNRGIKSWIKLIETQEQFKQAKAIGCNYLQGKLFEEERK